MEASQQLPRTVSQQVNAATGQKPKKINLLDNAVLVSVQLKKLGTSRKVSSAQVEVDADKDLLRVSKKLLDSPEIEAINKFDGEVRHWVYNQTLPSFIREGFQFIGLRAIESFDLQMKAYSRRRSELVENLCEAYEGIVEADKERLRATFNEDDYKQPGEVRRAFSMSWQYVALTAPKSLEAVSEEIYKSAQDQLNREITEAAEAVRFALREEMKGLVDWAVDRLSPDEQGKQKRFKTKNKAGEEIGFTARLNEFFGAFNNRNITNDFDLNALVARAKGLMTGVDAAMLKDSEPLRDTTRAGFEQIKKDLDSMLMNAPLRQIEVD